MQVSLLSTDLYIAPNLLLLWWSFLLLGHRSFPFLPVKILTCPLGSILKLYCVQYDGWNCVLISDCELQIIRILTKEETLLSQVTTVTKIMLINCSGKKKVEPWVIPYMRGTLLKPPTQCHMSSKTYMCFYTFFSVDNPIRYSYYSNFTNVKTEALNR